MIKRLIYSLFFHAIFLLMILGSFFSKDFDENDLSEVAVNVVAISGDSEASYGNKNKGKIPNKKTLVKEKNTPNPKKDELKEAEKKDEKPQEITPQETKKEPEKKLEKAETKTSKNEQPNIKETAEKLPENKNSEKPKAEEKSETKENIPTETKNEPIQSSDNEKSEQTNSQKQTSESGDNKSQEGGASNENISDIASLNLSAREKFNIQSQLKLCYNRASEEIGADGKVKITFKAKISLDGYITTNLDAIIDNQRYNSSDVDYKTSIDLAQRAVEICSPIRNLPLDKYEIWKEVILEFGGK